MALPPCHDVHDVVHLPFQSPKVGSGAIPSSRLKRNFKSQGSSAIASLKAQVQFQAQGSSAISSLKAQVQFQAQGSGAISSVTATSVSTKTKNQSPVN